jgi:hypothetical protein
MDVLAAIGSMRVWSNWARCLPRPERWGWVSHRSAKPCATRAQLGAKLVDRTTRRSGRQIRRGLLRVCQTPRWPKPPKRRPRSLAFWRPRGAPARLGPLWPRRNPADWAAAGSARLDEGHPGLTVELVLNDRFVDPTVEGVDLSIRLGPVGVGD